MKEFSIVTVNTKMKRAEEPRVNSDTIEWKTRRSSAGLLFVNSEKARPEIPEVLEDLPSLIVN